MSLSMHRFPVSGSTRLKRTAAARVKATLGHAIDTPQHPATTPMPHATSAGRPRAEGTWKIDCLNISHLAANLDCLNTSHHDGGASVPVTREWLLSRCSLKLPRKSSLGRVRFLQTTPCSQLAMSNAHDMKAAVIPNLPVQRARSMRTVVHGDQTAAHRSDAAVHVCMSEAPVWDSSEAMTDNTIPGSCPKKNGAAAAHRSDAAVHESTSEAQKTQSTESTTLGSCPRADGTAAKAARVLSHITTPPTWQSSTNPTSPLSQGVLMLQ